MMRFMNVTKTFKDGRGIKDCSFRAEDNEVTGVIGRNGSGKTTLFRIAARLLCPDSGEADIDGIPLEEYPLSKIGFMPEERSLRKTSTVYDMILLIGRLKGIPKKEAPGRVDELVKQLGLENNKFRRIGELSKGNARLIAYACAVIHNPRVLILDEPLSGLDTGNREELIRRIRKDREGKITLLSVHEEERIPELCDRVIRLHEGRIQHDHE